MSWLARAEQACVAVQVIISFYGTHDIGIYDRARIAVPFRVTVTLSSREEYYFVGLGNNNERDCGFETKPFTSVCGLANLRRRGSSLGART